MNTEQNLLLLLWLIAVAAVTFLVPKAKAHEFLLSFLACQAVGWIVETFLVNFDLVAYPIREFPKASDLGLTLKIVWTPVASGLYFIYKPYGKEYVRLFYFMMWVSGLTFIDAALARFTKLLDYVHFNFIYMALVYAVILFSVNSIVSRFFRDREFYRKEAGET